MCRDVHCPTQLTAAEHFDKALVVHKTGRLQTLRCHDIVLECLDDVEVEHVVLDPEGVGKATKLREPLRQGELATFETQLHLAVRLLALRTSAGGLATLAGGTAGYAALLPV